MGVLFRQVWWPWCLYVTLPRQSNEVFIESLELVNEGIEITRGKRLVH
jgi:hypothetical protein